MNNRNGILLMLAAMAGFTMEDVFIKQLSGTFSTSQILLTSGVFGSIFFAVVNHRKGHKILNLAVWTRLTLLSMAGEAVAAVALTLPYFGYYSPL